MSTENPETPQPRCPQCHAAVTSESPLCSACGAVLIGVQLSGPMEDSATLPQPPPTSQPLPQEQPPAPAQPAPGIPASGVVIHNYSGKPPAPKDHQTHPNLWMLAFPALGVVLILGLLFILLMPKSSHPAAASPTATAKPTATATPIPQARVVIRLLEVACTTTRDFFSADSFYIKSSLSAPAVDGGQTILDLTTNHYTINDNQKRSFGAGDQVLFDAIVPLSGKVAGSLTAYADDETQELDTTSIQVSASDSGQMLSWPINGRSGLNTWSYTVSYSTSITRLAAAPGVGSAIAGGSWLQIADTPAFQSIAA